MKRDDIPPTWDEHTILTTFLDYARATVHAKCRGLSEEDARQAPLPSSPLMTISGLVSHLRWVVFHLIEETARHNGHIDILREMADGVKGR
ncbi:MAG: DUF664 domain-containing protein [Streptosporangiaceae bacterium]|jgi:hypothetical protein